MIDFGKFFKENNINDRVEIAATNKEGELSVKYTTQGNPGTLRFTKEGAVFDGLNKNPVLTIDPLAAAVLIWGLGGNTGGPDTVTVGAMNLYRCLVQNTTEVPCESLKIDLEQKKVQARIDSAFAQARANWDGVNNFLHAARVAKVDEDDLEPLQKVVDRYRNDQPTGRPKTVEEAARLDTAMRRMIDEFYAVDEFEDIMKDKGTEEKTVYSRKGCPSGETGSITTYRITYSLGGLEFVDYEKSGGCSERKIGREP